MFITLSPLRWYMYSQNVAQQLRTTRSIHSEPTLVMCAMAHERQRYVSATLFQDNVKQIGALNKSIPATRWLQYPVLSCNVNAINAHMFAQCRGYDLTCYVNSRSMRQNIISPGRWRSMFANSLTHSVL